MLFRFNRVYSLARYLQVLGQFRLAPAALGTQGS